MKNVNRAELIRKITRVGSLKDMNQAIRLIENLGAIVIGWDRLTVSTLEHGDIAFELVNGRIIIK